MLRRVIAGLVLLTLAAAACGDDSAEESVSPSTTATPNTTEPPTSTSTTTVATEPALGEPLGFQDVNLMRCLDAECSRIHRTELDEQEKTPPMTLAPGVRQVRVGDILVRGDGRPLVLATWLTPHVGDDGLDREMVLYSCVDPACSSVTTQVVMAVANGWSGALLSDGSLAISYQTGEPILCGPTGCADPERNDLSSLELLLCPDPDDCSATGTGRAVVIDQQGVTGLFGGQMLVGPSGAPMVLYMREVGPGPGIVEIRLARCSDSRCSDVEVSTVLEPEAGDLMQSTVLADGSPVFIRQRLLGDGQEDVVVACEDPACSAWVESVTLSGDPEAPDPLLPFGLAADTAGGFFLPGSGPLFDADEFDGYAFSVLSCESRYCESPQRSPVLAEHRGVIGVGSAPPQVTPDGRLMFYSEIGAPEVEPVFLGYTLCDDVACSSGTNRALDDPALFVDEWDPGTEPGLLIFPLNTDAP